MMTFPDTSFLCSLYRKQDWSQSAHDYMQQATTPLPVSTLLLFEFRQSVRFQLRLFSRDRSKGFSKSEATAVLHALQADLADGILEVKNPDWADVHRIAETLSAKHTESGSHRFADILHVATALHFGTKAFLTFDDNQRTLAQAEGMTVPV